MCAFAIRAEQINLIRQSIGCESGISMIGFQLHLTSLFSFFFPLFKCAHVVETVAASLSGNPQNTILTLPQIKYEQPTSTSATAG